MRYAGQKRRATTSRTYAFGNDYDKVIKDAKKIHRDDEIFYVYKIMDSYSSISSIEYNSNKEGYAKEKSLEKYIFVNRRWQKE